MIYFLPEATLSGKISDFFTLNLFSLIYGEAVLLYYITIGLTVKLNDKETVNGSCFDQVSVC